MSEALVASRMRRYWSVEAVKELPDDTPDSGADPGEWRLAVQRGKRCSHGVCPAPAKEFGRETVP